MKLRAGSRQVRLPLAHVDESVYIKPMEISESSHTATDIPARERIVRAAQILFYQHGIRSTGVDRVILEAHVTKVTFYRHFPSKGALIAAYLERRHDEWIRWFRSALEIGQRAQSASMRRRAPLLPLYNAAEEWFSEKSFRGCAFSNTLAELGATVPAITPIAQIHKEEVCEAIASLLPVGAERRKIAWAATLALDGAVAIAVSETSTRNSLSGLRLLLDALTESYLAT